MATLSDEVRVPLLAGSRDSAMLDDFGELKEDLEIRYSLRDAKGELYRPDKVLEGSGASLSHLQGTNNGALRRGGSELAAAPRKKRQQYSGSEMIVAVFVVAFDTKKGEPLIVLLVVFTCPSPCPAITRECGRVEVSI